ncbi:MAG: type II secretion system protein [Proteobacteria bacterium]|nr:type II secretion system protein [Pseudomonadota bacterium]MCK4486749.1 type II secretion system protein [Desulfobacterales bacterium]
MINDKWKGFTLVEILVTLSIVGVMGAVAGGIYLNVQEEKGYEATVEIMEEIRKAILGSNTPHIRGVGISGYVADMGGLPPLNDDGQPESLWEQGEFQQPRKYYKDKRIWSGWNGPYIREPETGFLIDGWGNGISFRKAGYSLTITSYGADKKLGGLGLDEDITIVIKKEHYMAPVGGHVSPAVSNLTIYYPKNGVLKSEDFAVDSSDNFMSEELDIPIGLRSIKANVEGEQKVFVFSVQPTINWLGTLE